MIGIFDSGLGGLTVAREIMERLPGYDICYLGDTARTPYGNKSPETIIRYARENTEFLLEHGAQLIIVACNSASAAALEALEASYSVPIIGVIEPAARRAVQMSRLKRIGVIGTRSTIASGAYDRAILNIDPSAVVIGHACPLFVPLIEEGWAKRGETKRIIRINLQGLKTKSIDTLVLGCTHYGFIKEEIGQRIGRKTILVDPAEECAKYVVDYLKEHPSLEARLSHTGRHRFFVSDITDHFHALAQQWLKMGLSLEKAELG